MKLLVKADDFGFTEAINHGIIKSYTHGIVRSTAIMINMPAAAQALQMIVNHPGLCLGLHVNLVIGKPISPVSLIPSMVEDNGNFKSSTYYRALIAKGEEPMPVYEEVLIEVEAQLLKFYQMRGSFPEYIEGHAVHSDNVDKALSEIAKKYDLVHVSPLPDHSNRALFVPGRLYSIYEFYKKNLSPEKFFANEFLDIQGKEFAMVVLHPGYNDYEVTQMSSFQDVRYKDLYACTHPDTHKWIADNKIELISHRALTELISSCCCGE